LVTEVYILMLPGFAAVSEIIRCFSRKADVWLRGDGGATIAIAFIGMGAGRIAVYGGHECHGEHLLCGVDDAHCGTTASRF